MRNAFIRSLISHNHHGDQAYLLVGDLGYSVIEEFAENFPLFFLNIGVAEQNMAGIAAGIASDGIQVYCYSIGNFNTFRCAEQIRNDIDYHNLPVCTVSVGGGVAYGNMGYSHHAIQDYALMRSLPNTTIFAPIDSVETELCMEFIRKNKAPSYLRLHKAGERIVANKQMPVVPGLPRYLHGDEEARIAILSTGYAGQYAYEIAAFDDRCVAYTMPAWGMKSRSYMCDFAARFDLLIVTEDHLPDAGFGSWVLESLVGTDHVHKVRLKAIQPRTIGIVGSENFLHNLSELGLFDDCLDSF
jgi:transketolase